VEAGGPVPQEVRDCRDYLAQDKNVRGERRFAYKENIIRVVCGFVVADN
jgi:hypothetical protein